jgi:26S proteasome regulatory subunit N2
MSSSDASSSTKHGDISPISGSISNLADESKTAPPTSKPSRKVEPSSEKLANFSRVTPAQLAYITFPSEGRYHPVRAVSSKAAPYNSSSIAGKSSMSPLGLSISQRQAGGGGILILEDLHPDEETEFIDIGPTFAAPDAAPPPAQVGNGHAVHGPPDTSHAHIGVDDHSPEADPPEPFEVSKVYSEKRIVLTLIPLVPF